MENKWLVALGVFCLCVVIITVIGVIIWIFNEEEDSTTTSSKSTSTSSSSSTSPKKICYDTKLKIDPDKDCEEEYERLVCPSQPCRPEETKKMCYCLISPDELRTLPFVGKTYVLGNRKVTIKSDGEVLGQDNPWNECFRSYVTKMTTTTGKTRYVFDSGYYEDGLVLIYDGVDDTYKVATELAGFTPRTDCINSLRWV